MKLKSTKTNRGFALINFEDDNGATDGHIWLGVDDPDPQIRNPNGPGWVPYAIPEEVLLTTRMHLTRKQVKKLLPVLEHFVKTGLLP